MRSLLVGLWLLLAVFLSPHRAEAQAIVLPCVPSGTSCIPVSAANPLPTTSAITAGTTTVTCSSGTAGVLYQSSGKVDCGSTLTFTPGADPALRINQTVAGQRIARFAGTAANIDVYGTSGAIGFGNAGNPLTIWVDGDASKGVQVNAGGLFQVLPAGAAATPSLAVGNATTGFYSVSTTGLGISVNGVSEMDWGVTTASKWTLAGNVNAPGLAALGANTTGYVCWTTGTGALSEDSTTCLSSLRELKKDEHPFSGATAELTALLPSTFFWKEPAGVNQQGVQLGLIADDVEMVDRKLASYDGEGKLHGWRQDSMIALLIGGFNELETRVKELEAEIKELRKQR